MNPILLLYLFNDCFVTTEKFYSRISNFVAFYTTLVIMSYSSVNGLEKKQIFLFLLMTSILTACIPMFTYLVNRREVEQFVKKHATE